MVPRFLLLTFLLAIANARDGWWRQLTPPGSEPGVKVGGAGAVVGDSLYVVGGDQKSGGFLAYYTFKWVPDLDQWAGLGTFGRLPSNLQYSDIEAVGGLLFLFGGLNPALNESGFFNDVYILQLSSYPNGGWQQIYHDSDLPERNGHTINEIDGLVYLFGGWNSSVYFNDIWSFDTTVLFEGGTSGSWVNYNPATKPPARNSHSSVTYGGDLVVFGGFSHNTANGAYVQCTNPGDNCVYYNDLWRFSSVTKTWSKINPQGSLPAGRQQHTADVVGDRMLVFGGTNANGPLNDLWSYQFSRNEWVQLQPSGTLPQPRYGHVSGVIGGVLYIYGGSTKTVDTWSFVLNVEQTYDSKSTTDLGPLTGAAVFNVLVVFFIGVMVFFTYRALRSSSSTEKETTINDE